QGVWDPDANTLYVEAAELLDQHTKYVVVVTRGVKDATGMPVAPAKAFKRAMGDEADDDAVILDSRVLAYEHALRVAVKQLHYFGVRRHDIIAASVFTTMSVTAIAEKVRDQVNASPAPPPPGAGPVSFNVTFPSGAKPAGGWPVAIFVHGNGDNLHGAAFKVASAFASHGIATLCYQQVGHGFGPATTLPVTRSGVPAI